MAKDPAFLFYPNDYIGGTMGMTFEEKGAYIELLMCQFNRGHMTSHMCGQVVGRTWDNIKHKFEIDSDGLYYNVRLDIEISKRKAYTDSRKNNIKGINQHTKNSGHMDGHKTSHMEDNIINNSNSNSLGNVNTKVDTNKQFNRIEKAKIEFIESCQPYVEKYGQETIDDFIRYWTEPFVNKNKLRFEDQKTWSIGGRLSTWFRSPYNTRKNTSSKYPELGKTGKLLENAQVAASELKHKYEEEEKREALQQIV